MIKNIVFVSSQKLLINNKFDKIMIYIVIKYIYINFFDHKSLLRAFLICQSYLLNSIHPYS